MDPLTRLVALLRPQALLWKQMAARGNWAWRFPPDGGVLLGRVVEGRCRLHLAGEQEQQFGPGDSLLLTRPLAWVLRGGAEDVPPIDFESVRPDEGVLKGDPDIQDGVRIVGGHFQFESANTELLTSFLPPVLRIPSAEPTTSAQLGSIFSLIDIESGSEQPGREAVLTRLLEIVLIEVLRAPEMQSTRQPGMLNGLTDPQLAPALRAFHADIGRDWSVASLAAEAHMSRTVFFKRFTALVGQPPMSYALQWRMSIAKDALRFGGDRSVEHIAGTVGYGSASAFSTAFTRTVGVAPARFARYRSASDRL